MSENNIEQVFQTLNSEFMDLKEQINTLIKKYDDLEKDVKEQRKDHFQCNKCKERFSTTKELKKHKQRSVVCQASFECDQCELTYTSENQLSRHKQKHGKFSCKECDREFNFEGLLEPHIEVVHKTMKIFCHYFNNGKDCPFDEQCIFAHEDAKDCLFGNDCERMKCMFKHEEHFQDDGETEDEDSEDDEDDSDKNYDNSENYDPNLVQITDLEPSIRKVEEAMAKVNDLLNNKSDKLKCDKCDFEARNANGLNMHIKAKYTIK